MLESLSNKVKGLQAYNFTKNGLQHRRLPVNIANFKNNYFEKHLRTAASDSSCILHRKLTKVIQDQICLLFLLKHKITLFYLLSFVFIRFITRHHSLSLIVIFCYSLSFVVTRCYSLSLAVSLVATRCHSLYHSLSFVVTRCHSLSFDVPLVCLFINDLFLRVLSYPFFKFKITGYPKILIFLSLIII